MSGPPRKLVAGIFETRDQRASSLETSEHINDDTHAGDLTPPPAPVTSCSSQFAASEKCTVQKTFSPNDIGRVISENLGWESLPLFLQPWKPTKECDMPKSTHVKSGKTRVRRLLLDHLQMYPWLTVSRVSGYEGAFCFPCVLFARSSGVGGRAQGRGQIPGKLVSSPLTRFDDLTGKNGALDLHQISKYHQESLLAMERLKNVAEKKEFGVREQLNFARQVTIKSNREVLVPIVDTILTCARQNMALRGHRGESGVVDSSGSEPQENDGNFRALLRFRIRGGDAVLQKHAESANANATYMSSSIQNALIECAADIVRESVLRRIQKSAFWSIIADETMDRQKREQMALVIRYVAPDEANVWKVYEDPVAIVSLYEEIKASNQDEDQEVVFSGQAIGTIILQIVRKLGLDLHACVGQGYDGASCMASQRIGASALFLEAAPHAHYFHCASHCLNLCAAQSTSVASVRNALTVVKETTNFFNSSAKRNGILRDCIAKSDDNRVSKSQLTTLCQTRFIERHTAVVTMRSLMRFIIESLETMKTSVSKDTSDSANKLCNCICTSDFVVALVIVESVCATLLPTTRILQTKGLDLVAAMQNISQLIDELQEMQSEHYFSKLYAEAELLATSIGITLAKPRCASRSVYRSAAVAVGGDEDTPESYYRINVFYPTMDCVTADLKLRFGPKQRIAAGLGKLIPQFMKYSDDNGDEDWNVLWPAVNLYSDVISESEIVVRREYGLWRRQWAHHQKEMRPTTAIASIDAMEPSLEMYPSVKALLQILATLPVVSVEAERLFSKMEKTLSAIRATMTEVRLEALLLLQVHRDLTPSPSAVIDRFAATQARRMKFAL